MKNIQPLRQSKHFYSLALDLHSVKEEEET